ncbi:MAG: nucleoside kinase [Bacteroidales bacterium]|nr:nucleoside kinase [Clostridium sp.]MCM1202951.1 nucleoside kinase [Bacteroidales bacterium]
MVILITVEIDNQKYEVEEGVTLKSLADTYGRCQQGRLVLAYRNGHLCELYKQVTEDAKIEFVSTVDKVGMAAYKRSMILMMMKAFRDVLKEKGTTGRIRVLFSLSRGFYCELDSKKAEVSGELLAEVEMRMKTLVEADIPIEKYTYQSYDLMKRFKAQGRTDKERLFRYRRASNANVYVLEDFEDYYYGFMVPSTGYLTHFALHAYEQGFVLQMPERKNPVAVPEFKPQNKLFQVLKQSDDWGVMLHIDTVGGLNDAIANGEINDLMLVQEALQEKNIAEIAGKIREQKKKVILIAGPSSSGKTSFSHRLCIQLRALGMSPHPIALDNYFVDREFTPKDADGNYDFECIEAVDVDRFNEDVMKLLNGEEVAMPTFNFLIGKREYKGNTMKLARNDVLVIEGIHGLNPKMSEQLPEESKFKIYISALTQLNVDEHNRIATTDGRLIRRIVRDARTRGNSARDTIGMWESVRRGEEQNIFPYQEEADVMFNSALIYELSVIKPYVEPLLFAIPREAKEYQEAKRLLKFLDYFLGVSSENIPNNSILREFVGGSCFPV